MTDGYQFESRDIGVYVPIEAVYPQLQADESTLLAILSGLSRDDTLLVAARINTIVTGFGMLTPVQRQQAACAHFCTLEEGEKINEFAKQHGGAEKTAVFFRGQLLELIRWIAKYCTNAPTDGATFENPDVRRRFLQAALIAGAIWGRRTYGDRLSPEGEIGEARERALGALRKGMEESGISPHAGIVLGRGWVLFSEYFPRRYPSFDTEFDFATKLTTEQYYVCVAALSQFTFAEKAGGPIFRADHVGDATAYSNVFPIYFALEAQEVLALCEALWHNFESLGYRSIRERPILNLSQDRSIVLDPTFYSEKLTIGPLFHILTGVSAQKANEIFGAFGLAFEDYANDILKRMYPNSGVLVKRLSWNEIGNCHDGTSFEVDAVLNDAVDVAVFEMKAAWLREDKIVSGSYETFLNHLRLKYGGEAKTEELSQGRRKGVAQLARSVGAIARREWVGQGNEFEQAKTIYPVLVVHDVRMSVPALGNFLDSEFRALLGQNGLKVGVAPLTVMTIDDLENLESSVGKFSLIELLADYTRQCPDRVRSLHNFMAFAGYAEKINPPTSLRRKSEELMALLKANLFPAQPPT